MDLAHQTVHSAQAMWLDQLTFDSAAVIAVKNHMLAEMHRGLLAQGVGTQLAMIPTYVAPAKGHESGMFFAIDFGGTNFRVAGFSLNGGAITHPAGLPQMTVEIPEEVKTGSAAAFFNWIADNVLSFMESVPRGLKQLGFTFSFPTIMESINRATLEKWTKNFSIPELVREPKPDIVQSLQAVLDTKRFRDGTPLAVKIVALANDTTGTLVASSYEDASSRRPLPTRIGTIIGTGLNSCYIEKVSNVPALRGESHYDREVIINTEWGNIRVDLAVPHKYTLADRHVDMFSNNHTNQIFEKMAAGHYIGPILQTIIKLEVAAGRLFPGQTTLTDSLSPLQQNPFEMMAGHSCLDGFDLNQFAEDVTANLDTVGRVLHEKLHAQSSLPERTFVKNVARAIVLRSARLAGAGMAALIEKMGGQPCTIAVDGSLVNKYGDGLFRQWVHAAVAEATPSGSMSVLVPCEDGSGKGAAVIAAVVAHSPQGALLR